MRIRGLIYAIAFFCLSYSARAGISEDFWDSFPPLSLPVSTVFGDCGDPCIVRDNDGGAIALFNSVAITVRKANILLVIDGYCASACALIADTARPNVCITANANFYFHMATYTKAKDPVASIEMPLPGTPEWYAGVESGELIAERFPTKQSPDILKWIEEQGGFPLGFKLEEMLGMNALQASEFWPICGPEVQVLPRLRPEWPPTPRPRPPRT
ncbi:MAG: hypothetical protein KBD50_04055 [Candidatus Pacebacteria bacterium]|nr:hypothetical protein [Candidatus Paceibacterota bacterium]